MEDEKLINSVKRYQFLYDLSHPYYTDGESKDKAWKVISEDLRQPASACKNRWQKLRDSYRRVLNKRKLKRLPSSRKLKKWTYETEMSFLLPYLVLKTVDLANDELMISDGNQSSQPIDFDSIEGDCKPQVTWDMDRLKTGDGGIRNTEITDNITYDEVQNGVWNDLSHYTNNNAEDCVSDASTIETKKQKRPNTKKSDAQLLNSATLIAQLLKRTEDSQTRDDIDHFFMNMASTVRKFSPYTQAITKNKIFSLVSRCEIEHLASLS